MCDTVPSKKSPARKRWTNAIRLAVCVAALAFVVRGVTFHDRLTLRNGDQTLTGLVTEQADGFIVVQPDGDRRVVPKTDVAVDEHGEPKIEYGLRTAWRRSRVAPIVLALLIFLPVPLLQGVRLRWLLHAQAIQLGYAECIKLSFAGNFVNFATPLGSNAGDVFKAYFVTAHTKHKTEAATTIGLDRAIGLGTLIICMTGLTAFAAADSRIAVLRPYVLMFLAAGVVALIVYLSPVLRIAAARLVPKRWVDSTSGEVVMAQVRRVDAAVRALLTRKGIVVASVLITVLLQVLAMTSYFFVADALQLDARLRDLPEYYTYFYAGTVIQALPGPPQGLGTVELAYRYFLAPFGSPSQIVCTAFMIRVVVLVCALPGLVVTLTGSYKPQAARDAPLAVKTSDAS